MDGSVESSDDGDIANVYPAGGGWSSGGNEPGGEAGSNGSNSTLLFIAVSGLRTSTSDPGNNTSDDSRGYDVSTEFRSIPN